MLELRQYKNDSIWSKETLVWKLPRFFTHCIDEWKNMFRTKWSRSYIVLALVLMKEHTVGSTKIRKKRNLAVYFKQSFLPYISGTIRATKNLFTIACIIFWRAFSWERSFSNWSTKSADLADFPTKSQLLKKSAILENLRYFFMDSKLGSSFYRLIRLHG